MPVWLFHGENLISTSSVELVKDLDIVPLTIISVRAGQVRVVVPAGLEPGTYSVHLTNSGGTVTGPATFTVKGRSRHEP